jgi:hypothetical protein
MKNWIGTAIYNLGLFAFRQDFWLINFYTML